eukprot:s91_g37.t1
MVLSLAKLFACGDFSWFLNFLVTVLSFVAGVVFFAVLKRVVFSNAREIRNRPKTRQHVGLVGPVLARMSAYVSKARVVRQRRAMGTKRRGFFSLWHEHAFLLKLEEVSLEGGGAGSRVTAKKRRNVLMNLKEAVADLAQQVQQMQQMQMFAFSSDQHQSALKSKPVKKKKPKQSKQNPRAEDRGAPATLFKSLLEAVSQWQTAKQIPSEAILREQLQAILNNTKPGKLSQQPQPKKQTAETQLPKTTEKTVGADTKTWSSLFKKETPPKSTGRLHLYGPAWSAPVITLNNVQEHSIDQNLVICCQNNDEKDRCKEWLRARGFSKHATYVTLCPDGDTDVLVHSRNGPRPVKALVEKTANEAPSIKAMPQQLKDDEEQKQDTKSSLLRLTLARDFADQQLSGKVVAKPQFLPAVAFSEQMKKHVLQTRAAVTYEKEITCLILVRDDKVQEILKVNLPPGIFGNRHQSTSVPQWFLKAREESNAAYWQRISRKKDESSGRLVYRSSNNAPLGILDGKEKCAESIAPRWILNNTPPEWGESEVNEWSKQRGFVSPANFRRQGRRTWFFRAQPPDVGDANLACVFKSGISVAPAKTAPARNYKAVSTSKNTWGAPEPRNFATNDDVEIVEPENADNAVNATVPDTQESMDVEQNDKPALQRSPPKRLESDRAKKAKTDQSPPWQDHFNVVPNGGEGDCAYISIAQCLAHENGTLKKAKKDDFKPKGRLQAQLRVLASQELGRRKAFYVKEHGSSVVEDTLIAGTWADSVSLYALAHAANLDIRIWSFENILQQWNFYQIRPDAPKKPDVAKKHQPTVVYLKLNGKHYEWLNPSQNIPAELELQWLNTVKLRPPTLSGGGKKGSSSGSSHDAMSVLGLKQPAASSSHDPPILGLKRSKRAKKAQSEDLDKLSEIFPGDVPEPGSHLRCSCGWTPPPGSTSVQRSKANSHWQICKGERAPAMPKKDRLAILMQAGQTAAQKAKAKNEADWNKWCREIRSKHPELKDTLCDPNFDVPFYNKSMGRQFACRKCGETRGFSRMRRFPCKKRPAGITIRTWQTTIHGRFLDPGRPSRLVKNRQTPEFKQKQAQKAAARRRAQGALPGQGKRTDLLKKRKQQGKE